MKQLLKRMAGIVTCLIFAFFVQKNGAVAQATEIPIAIDGYYDDWADKPYSWEFFWNNHSIPPESYSLENRHQMFLYRDLNNVYLHITISDNSYEDIYGDQYSFWLDGQVVYFYLAYQGKDLAYGTSRLPAGIYNIEVRHDKKNMQYRVAYNSQAKFTKTADNVNNQIEIKIPISAMDDQQKKIAEPESIKTIQFFNPYMMYRSITCAGTSTGPFIGIAICIAVVGGVYYFKNYRRQGKKKQEVS